LGLSGEFELGTQQPAGRDHLRTGPQLTISKTTNRINAADAQTCNYTYDDLTRIKSVDCGASKWQQNFSYDAFGNITKTVPTGGTGISFTPGYAPTTNRFTSVPGGTPTYDANGNLTNDFSHSYTWDTEGRAPTAWTRST
jgi:hypothetical protein